MSSLMKAYIGCTIQEPTTGNLIPADQTGERQNGVKFTFTQFEVTLAGCPDTFNYYLVDADNSANLVSNPSGLNQPVPAAASTYDITPSNDNILNSY